MNRGGHREQLEQEYCEHKIKKKSIIQSTHDNAFDILFLVLYDAFKFVQPGSSMQSVSCEDVAKNVPTQVKLSLIVSIIQNLVLYYQLYPDLSFQRHIYAMLAFSAPVIQFSLPYQHPQGAPVSRSRRFIISPYSHSFCTVDRYVFLPYFCNWRR